MYECRKREDPYGQLEDIYAYINNAFQCLSNTVPNDELNRSNNTVENTDANVTTTETKTES